jgi:hypothetical protein
MDGRLRRAAGASVDPEGESFEVGGERLLAGRGEGTA